MAELTKSLLSEYYGFGSKGRLEKTLSSHTGTSNLELLPDEIEVLNTKQDEEKSENVTKDNFKDGYENTANNLDSRNLLIEKQERSSRVLSEENLLKDDTADENYKMFLETNSNMNDYLFKNEKPRMKHEEPSINIDKSQLKLMDDISDTNLITPEESAAEIRSTISSPMPKKRLSRKLKTSVIPLKPPPKKVPTCNGVYLDLTSAGISEFPVNVLDKLSNLKMLYLENNKLTELPNELFPSLRLLYWLDVRNNQLTSLPSNIESHPCLETILLQGNRIEKLPLELCQVPMLKRLQTTSNPLIFPPKDILAQGFTAILEYLRQEWEKLHPEDIIKTNRFAGREKELDEIKPDLTTILCYKPKPLLKKKTRKVPDHLPEISSTSTSSSDANIYVKTVRQKAWDYKPSNRCSNKGENITTEMRLMWISKVKEMLTKQALALQRMKDKEALKDWRQDKSSFDKSIKRASNRTIENIPFAIDLNDIPMISKQDVKMQNRNGRKEKRGIILPTNINHKIQELFDSLGQLQSARQSQSLSPTTEQKLLEVEIKKISDLQDEIQNLKRYNDVIVAPLMETHNTTPRKQTERPPSFII